MRPSSMMMLRRSARSIPRLMSPRTVPLPFLRRITIEATPGSHNPDGTPSFQLVSGSGGSSQHPFSDASFSPESNGDGSSGNGEGSSSSAVTALPPPPPPVKARTPHLQHPFDTHAFVSYLEKSNIDEATSIVLMESVRELIIQRKMQAYEKMLDKEDMENAAYLFRAALSEARAELSVRAKADAQTLQQTTLAIRREVESLEQKMKEDIQTLKHDIEMDMNNRKAETRSEQKGFDLFIEEINSKFTISIGDLRTEIESAKWDSVRRAISLIVIVVVSGVGMSLYTAQTPTPPPITPTPPVEITTAPVMKDASTGTEDLEAQHVREAEQKLEKILSDADIPVKPSRKRRGSKDKEDVFVDRI